MSEIEFSIIIPVKPGGEVKALEALKRSSFPAERVELLIAEGTQPSRQRNMAAAQARGRFLYFLDDDSIIAAGSLERISHHFTDPQVGVVGGPSLTPPEDGPWQQAFGAAFSSILGGGGVRNRYRKHGRARFAGERELILCNLAIRREVFLQFNGFDERLYPNEENELLDRLLKAGFRSVHDPDIAVYRSQRATFRAFVRQLLTYGRGRGEQARISGKLPVSAAIPSLFLLYMLSLPVVANAAYTLPLACYAFAVVCFAAADAVRVKRGMIMPLLLAVFPALHLSYGTGLIWGLLSPRFRRPNGIVGQVVISRITDA
ncbi:glycosyltransferase [Geobacter sp. DSM 9736]|uniref:glycosyltransferase n=1 Tax=Geobacter sp. DSM 9736 TaxID=1277350 RepID=UPI000B50CE20|nr:glycosyltransferase [Geobacter sp. DSM 9736]SNB46638.1 Glycosyltransferase like family 2 [Geobacter sp. DSM 9736]